MDPLSIIFISCDREYFATPIPLEDEYTDVSGMYLDDLEVVEGSQTATQCTVSWTLNRAQSTEEIDIHYNVYLYHEEDPYFFGCQINVTPLIDPIYTIDYEKAWETCLNNKYLTISLEDISAFYLQVQAVIHTAGLVSETLTVDL